MPNEIESKHAMFIFDACFSGSLFNLTRAIPEIISYKTTQPVRQFISSGTEDEEVSDESIFRKQFVDAISSSNADFNEDGYLTGTELGRFLQSSVINYSNDTQHPQYGKIDNPALNKGDFVFKLLSESDSVRRLKRIVNLDPPGLNETRGSIEVSTEIGGDIYLDGKLLSSVSPNTIVPILDVSLGLHYLELKGKEKWQKEVNISSVEPLFIEIETQVSRDLNSEFIPMVYVQGGTFEMGTIYGESDEQPIHSITLNDFEISAHEITVAQFRQFVTETGYKTEAEQEGWSWIFDSEWKKKNGFMWSLNSEGEKAGDFEPVTYISWNDCIKFTEWMSEKFKEKFRLPTEAEWEYAAKGGVHNSTWVYSGSNIADSIGWFTSNSKGAIHQIAEKSSNALNIFDMSGNVWEWCLDWYNEHYYSRSTFSNPKGPLIGEFRVIRGGSWINSESTGRVTNRHKYRPLDRDNLTGFRIVREVY